MYGLGVEPPVLSEVELPPLLLTLFVEHVVAFSETWPLELLKLLLRALDRDIEALDKEVLDVIEVFDRELCVEQLDITIAEGWIESSVSPPRLEELLCRLDISEDVMVLSKST